MKFVLIAFCLCFAGAFAESGSQSLSLFGGISGPVVGPIVTALNFFIKLVENIPGLGGVLATVPSLLIALLGFTLKLFAVLTGNSYDSV